MGLLDICEGKRVLYKHKGQWCVGKLTEAHNTKLTEDGLFLSIIPREFFSTDDIPYLHDAEINDIFLDAFEILDYFKDSEYLMTKEDYIALIESEDFDRRFETAYVSDGEYGYYPISKFTKNWLMKQPFDYVIRSPECSFKNA